MPLPSKLTDRAWAELFARELTRRIKEPPPNQGWLTKAEISRISSKTKGALSNWICAMRKAGDLEIFNGTQRIENGNKLGKQVWYRPTKR